MQRIIMIISALAVFLVLLGTAGFLGTPQTLAQEIDPAVIRLTAEEKALEATPSTDVNSFVKIISVTDRHNKEMWHDLEKAELRKQAMYQDLIMAYLKGQPEITRIRFDAKEVPSQKGKGWWFSFDYYKVPVGIFFAWNPGKTPSNLKVLHGYFPGKARQNYSDSECTILQLAPMTYDAELQHGVGDWLRAHYDYQTESSEFLAGAFDENFTGTIRTVLGKMRIKLLGLDKNN